MSLLLRLARTRDIAAEIADRLAAAGSEEVVVASNGMAEAIAAELLARRPEGVAAVRLQMLSELARRIINDAGEYPRVATEAERRLAMRTATRSIDDPMMSSRGIAAMLERSYRDVRDGGMTLADFDARARRTAVRNRARTQLVVRAWREYERLIAQSGAIDPSELLARATALVPRVAIAPQVVAGFYDMTGAQLRFVEALRDAGKLAAVFVPAGESDAYAFARPLIARFAGATLSRDPQLRIREPQVGVTSFDTRVNELHDVCAAVRELLDDGVAPRAIGIVARALDDYDVRLLNRFAAEEGFATTSRDGVPLVAHRIGRGIATLLRLRDDGFARGEVIELLRDGFTLRRKLDIDEIDFATRKSRMAGGASDELAKVCTRRPLDDYAAAVADIEAVAPPAVLRGAEWRERLELLASRFRAETERDLLALEAIDDVARLFGRWPAVTFDSGAVLDALEQRELPGDASPMPAVIASDVMSFRGRSFEHLFVVRMQDDLFPQRRNDDPLLPDHDRRLLGMREIGDGRDEERLLFELLLDAASDVRFSFAATDGFGKVLRPSPLLRGYPRVGHTLCAPTGLNSIDAGRGAQRAPGPRQLQLLAKSGLNSEFDGYLFATEHDDAVRAKLLSKLQTISPTHLEDFGECPQKFLFKHILGAVDIDDPERDLQLHPRDKGKLDHRILERFYREIAAIDFDDVTELLPRLETLIDTAFDEFHADQPPFNRAMRAIERRATKRVLREFVTRDLADLAASGLEPRHFEYRFGASRPNRESHHPEPFVIEAGGVAMAIEGSIDRIDVSAAGHHRIVDYKSGKAGRHKKLEKKIDRGVRLQLALYAMAVAEFFSADSARVSGAIKPLVASGEKAETFAFALADKATRLRETLDLFAASILRGLFPAFPNDEDEDVNSCKYCPVNLSCRTRHDAEAAFAVRAEGEPRTLLERMR